MSETSATFEWPGSRAIFPAWTLHRLGSGLPNVDYKDLGHSVFFNNELILHHLQEFFKKYTNHPVTSTTNL